MILADPNIAYILLLVGLWSTVFAVYKPGTGIIEPLAILALVGAAFALAALPTNWLAIAPLVAGTLGFVLAPLYKRSLVWIAPTCLALQVLGSLVLFSGAAVSLPLIGLGFLSSLLLYLFVILPISRKQTEAAVVGDERLLVDASGYVTQALDPIGTVNIRGEFWTAYSNEPLPVGERIVVVEKEGLRLFVEKAKAKHLPRRVADQNDAEDVDAELNLSTTVENSEQNHGGKSGSK